MKRQKHKKLFSILIVIDDHADCPQFCRQSKLLHSLYTRGRHNSISCITSSQKFNALAPIIRVNATELCLYRLRIYKDIETQLEEVSALAPKPVLLEIYNLATHDPYSFLYVNLRAKKKNEMFYIRFDKKWKLIRLI